MGAMIRKIGLALLLATAVAGCTVKDESTIPAPPDVAKPPADALMTPSGIASKVLIVGLGSVHPGPLSWVTVHYTGWTTDGHMFDSSVVKKEPLPKSPPTLCEMMKLITELGGYNNRATELPPGPQPLWVGLRRMLDFATVWLNFGPDAQKIRV